MKKNLSLLFDHNPEEILEVPDLQGRPLLFMPREIVLRQKLPHRKVVVGLLDRENKIYIQQYRNPAKGTRSLWDIPASALIRAGEAAEDAARRAMLNELGLADPSLERLGTIHASPQSGWGHIIVFASRPAGVCVNPPAEREFSGIFVDQDELGALRRDMPELLSPHLILKPITELLWKPYPGRISKRDYPL